MPVARRARARRRIIAGSGPTVGTELADGDSTQFLRAARWQLAGRGICRTLRYDKAPCGKKGTFDLRR